MFFKMHYTIFFSSLIMGTMMAISSNNWFMAWAGLEINLMSMIPLILIKLTSNLSEAAIKYFIPQALASLCIIVSSLMSIYFYPKSQLILENPIITLAIFIKAGMAPFHFWFPQISNLLNWMQCLIMFTWQKMAPLLFIFFINSYLISLVAISSAVMGAMGGLNQNNLKILLSYSSISHAGWMTTSCILSMKMWTTYFLSYILISLTLMRNLHQNKLEKNSMMSFLKKKYLLLVSLNLFSLGGLPPLLGFYPKMMVLLATLNKKMIWTPTILLMSSIISLMFYFRMITSALSMKTQNNFIKIYKMTFNYSYETFTIVFLNIFIPMFFLIL